MLLWRCAKHSIDQARTSLSSPVCNPCAITSKIRRRCSVILMMRYMR